MKVFVYGSLKKGYWNHVVLDKTNSKYIGEAILFGYSLYHVANYPGMVKSNNPLEKVYGETYLIHDDTLEILDHLEGEGFLYERKLLLVFNGIVPTEAYSYIYLPEIRKGTPKVLKNNWIGRP